MDDTGVREDIGGAAGLRIEHLSERKRRILDGVVAGKSNGVLAEELGITVDGVKWHVSELLGDTGLADRHELAAWWRRVRGPVAPAALTLGWPSRSTLAGLGRFALGVAMTAVLALGVIAGWRCSGSSNRSAGVSPGATSPLGKVAYVLDGDIWVKTLPDGKPQNITQVTQAERDVGSTYGRPAWSPSGGWLSIWKGKRAGVMRADGRDARYFETVPLTWSPVADQLAYVGSSQPSAMLTDEVVVEDADGAHPSVVARCNGPCGISGVTWRSDGAEVAYVEMTPGTPPEDVIKHVRADGIGTPAVYFDDATHPTDGLGILTWEARIMLVYRVPNFSASVLADGVTIQEARDGQQNLSDLVSAKPVALLDPSLWSAQPRTDLMVITDGSGRESWTNKRIAVVSRGSGTANDATPAGIAAIQPSLYHTGPNDELIAYSAAPDAGTGISGGDAAKAALAQRKIWISESPWDAQGLFETRRQLTSDPAYRDEFPQFSPDGKQILFARMDAHDAWSLWLIPSAGGDPKQVVPAIDASILGDSGPAWWGYYGTIPWHDVFDWWRPSSGQ